MPALFHTTLFIRNLYLPFKPNKPEKHYLIVGRIAIAVTLFGGIAVALFINNLLELFKYIISVPAIFGASIWLGFIWRRLTKSAVFFQVAVCLIIYAAIPNLFQTLDWAKYNKSFLLETKPKTVIITLSALRDDVEAGKAEYIGQSIKKQHTIEPTGVFFEKVARIDSADPSSPKVGLGRFHAEIWVLSWFGIDFSNFTKAQLVATRFFFDALFPFLFLFLISSVTRPAPKSYLDRFYAKMFTPVQKTPGEEKKALENSYKNPEKFEKHKILPGSNWEILKPTKTDFLGFGGSWILVGVIIFLLWIMISIR